MAIAPQDVIVTVIAAAALLLVGWRLIRVAGPAEGKPACSNCSSCAPVRPDTAYAPPGSSPTPLVWLSRDKPRI